MVQTVGSPECVKCDRGSRYNSASLAGNEPFFLVPSEIILRGLHQGKTWVVFCGSCLRKLLGSKQDLSNLIPKHEIKIIVEKGIVSIKVLP